MKMIMRLLTWWILFDWYRCVGLVHLSMFCINFLINYFSPYLFIPFTCYLFVCLNPKLSLSNLKFEFDIFVDFTELSLLFSCSQQSEVTWPKTLHLTHMSGLHWYCTLISYVPTSGSCTGNCFRSSSSRVFSIKHLAY